MNSNLKKGLCVLSFLTAGFSLFGQSTESDYLIKMDVDKIGSTIQPTMYGVFFEDINFGADGGLYAELIKNRSFEFEYPFTGWTPFGDVSIRSDKPCFDRNPLYARLINRKQLTGTGLINEGFKGIGIKTNEKYDLSFYARTLKNETMKLKIEMVSDKNDIIESKEVSINSKSWNKYMITFAPMQTCSKSSIRITMLTTGVLDIEHISLFPQETFNNRSNGLRKDLAMALKDLKPGVFRFPGGCIVEGTDLSTRYQWKNTIGPVENRPININRWNYTFSHKKFPDYYQSYGLGFYEYFVLSEDIGAEPLPVLNCGLSCQYENNDPNQNCPVDKLEPYIEDALDLIEFANGPITSTWGKIRADMGHPAPFNLKMIAIGNEQWGTLYTERLEPFVKAIRAKYPNIKIIGSSGPQAEGKDFDFLWPEMKRIGVDLVDEHYYRSPEWFLSNANRYDSYDRNGPKVFAGEYACHAPDKENSFLTALSEAAFMTGLERNADVVHLCTYAPLFAHKEAWQWRPDLIWFDNLSFVKTPNYYVQQLFGNNAGTHVLALTMNGKAVSGQQNLYATAASDAKDNTLIIKIANTGIDQKKVSFILDGLKAGVHAVILTHLNSSDLNAKNSFETPDLITPKVVHSYIKDNKMDIALPPLSFTILRIAR
ncbi:MAG: carbohydrate binding domain-containing protein [Bacteroidota bacterium]|uniref:alpha-L-arabinofuranosidase C-terminal domain-containing protein n=1 Tax=Macellibacteroides fermentans TaxID=879969 RepID=UPI00288CF737|nr:carbohydrate binding domain-containing protein [Bacteroidota bacterium]HML72506.1 alpha-L-arabinofuranosidase C-terminal domain-containing protein [Macellibacteroides fermentans]